LGAKVEMKENYSHTRKSLNAWQVFDLLDCHLTAVPTDEDDIKFHFSIEEYLQSLISLINELVPDLSSSDWLQSRLAVNSVTMGNYSRPLAISRFVKELSTAFQVLNLKNDNLRKRFDSIKYDVKKRLILCSGVNSF
jgi:hypothetical protein